MLDIKFIRKEPEKVKEALSWRNDNPDLVDQILELDKKRRECVSQTDVLKAERNSLSQQVAKIKSEDKTADVASLIEKSKLLGEQIKENDVILSRLEEQQLSIVSLLPNMPSEQTPKGKDENSNKEIRRWGEPRVFDFEPLPHWDLGPKLGMMDFERASKLSGSRFVVLKDKISALNRALIAFMLDTHTLKHGYVEVNVPHLVKRESMFATGQLPKFEEEAYRTDPDDYFLIPTAEIFLAGMHRDEILNEKELPLKYVAYSSCYRREAGSYGKDVRGMIRVHQFEKVELVTYCTPETSFQTLEQLTSDAERILQLLELPYRVVSLCTGDIGFGAALTYDLEVWLPSYQNYREISSCSNDTDFQARRANMRYRNSQNKLDFVHTLNGSGLAVGRTLVAILENYQNPDGSIRVPQCLIPYMNGNVTIS
jgi:seryl-tRNA synthetase